MVGQISLRVEYGYVETMKTSSLQTQGVYLTDSASCLALKSINVFVLMLSSFSHAAPNQ